ncbi:MAG: molybdopterin molybdotransferase MoeA [Deltaproteobacteria bacterium]|nr:molybdopterin molybdotransferase MoeA [Deltaproteobacteria bacterium]
MAKEVEKMLSLEEAQRVALAAAVPLATEKVQLEDASGRVLAEEVRAFRDEPAATQTAMDGYAVHSEDVEAASSEKPVLLAVVGTVGPGQHLDRQARRKEAIRVMTGATLPAGADAVIPHEMAEIVAEGVVIKAPVAPGDYLIPAGAELQMDQHLLSDSTVLGVKELTILATQGYSTVKVRRQPVVAVLATGSELVEVGKSLDQNRIFASNLHTVSNLVNHYGGRVRVLGIAGDQVERLTPFMEKGNRADVIVTTGGTGKGEKDLVSNAIQTLGGDVLFHGVAMSPGKQALFAKLGGTLLFGLPGRPAATYIAFEQLVRPVLLQMLGLSQVFPPETTAVLSSSVKVRGKLLSFLLGRLIFRPAGLEVESLRSESKGILTEMLAANCLLQVPPGRNWLNKGERVTVQLLDLGLEGLSYFQVPSF